MVCKTGSRAWKRQQTSAARAAVVGGVLLVAALSGRTAARVPVWESDLTLWESVVATAPDSRRGRYNLAMELADAGRVDEAVAHLQHVLRLSPDHPHARRALRALEMRGGDSSTTSEAHE